MTAIRRVLVANRGEIALRIIRACHELGMQAVAVFSDADASAAHTRAADLAIRIGPPPATESYLRIDAMIEVALAMDCDAVHPGYGFLSEREAFARAVEDAGLVFVGPAPDTLAALGDKLAARRVAASVEVPAVPGTLNPVSAVDQAGLEALLDAAGSIGFPMMVKASAGGGGRGMRRVDDIAALPDAVQVASREAEAAFGDGSVYLERLIGRARHVEVQLIGDQQGNIVAVGERDCSLQRRHQKLIEEAPAPGLTEDQRRLVHAMAERVARAVGLRNLATAEFLYDEDGQFWFLEVNTRLQVEHGVTELVTGLDLVHEQLRIARGEPLSARVVKAAERAAAPDIHAVEARLSAEDPARGFAPVAGRITRWRMPDGPGVRVDTAIEQGDVVSPHYDPLIAKLLVAAEDRPTALARLCRAVNEIEVGGLQTTLPFVRHVAGSPAFVPDLLSTAWVEEHWDGGASRARAARAARLGAGLEALERRPSATSSGRSPSGRSAGGGWSVIAREEAVDRWPT